MSILCLKLLNLGWSKHFLSTHTILRHKVLLSAMSDADDDDADANSDSTFENAKRFLTYIVWAPKFKIWLSTF